MAWNLANFRENIKSIGLNQYFEINFDGVEHLNGFDSDQLTALCRTTELPAKVLETQNVAYYGADYKIASRATFNDWTVTFLDAILLRSSFVTWCDKVYDISKLKIENDHTKYKTDSVTVKKTSIEKEASTIKFYGLFPSSVGPVNFDQSGGTPTTFDVTFSYDFFVTEK
jgi:hypothetical protein